MCHGTMESGGFAAVPVRFHLRLLSNHRKAALKEAFTALMTADAGKVAAAIDALVARLSKEAATRKLIAKEQLVLRLNEQYPKARCSPCFRSHCLRAAGAFTVHYCMKRRGLHAPVLLHHP